MDNDPAGRRPTLTLDGLWDFEFEGPTARLGGGVHTIRSPGIWQAQFPALRNAQGTGRCRRRVQVPWSWAGKRIVLVMEGVFHESVILVDEVAVAVHGDGWTPIEVDLTDALGGKTSFVLGVDARVPDDRNGGRFSQSLAGKQDWYGVQGGIWKAARLEARDPVHLSELAVRCAYDLARGTVAVKGMLSQTAKGGRRLTLSRSDQAERNTTFQCARPSSKRASMFLVPDRGRPTRRGFTTSRSSSSMTARSSTAPNGLSGSGDSRPGTDAFS